MPSQGPKDGQPEEGVLKPSNSGLSILSHKTFHRSVWDILQRKSRPHPPTTLTKLEARVLLTPSTWQEEALVRVVSG